MSNNFESNARQQHFRKRLYKYHKLSTEYFFIDRVIYGYYTLEKGGRRKISMKHLIEYEHKNSADESI